MQITNFFFAVFTPESLSDQSIYLLMHLCSSQLNHIVAFFFIKFFLSLQCLVTHYLLCLYCRVTEWPQFPTNKRAAVIEPTSAFAVPRISRCNHDTDWAGVMLWKPSWWLQVPWRQIDTKLVWRSAACWSRVGTVQKNWANTMVAVLLSPGQQQAWHWQRVTTDPGLLWGRIR